jgi:hypothetical protein
MKYKQGDIVKIKPLKWYEDNKNSKGLVYAEKACFTEGMSKYCGKNVTIISVYNDRYYIEGDPVAYSFIEEFFEDPIHQLVISEEKAKELYKTASVEFKSILEETFGKEFFSEDIRENVKTLYDAKEIYALKNTIFRQELSLLLTKEHAEILKAFISALVISEALNEGWEPDWNDTSQQKYTVRYNSSTNTYFTYCYNYSNSSLIFFKSKKLAEHFIKQFPEICKILYNGK